MLLRALIRAPGTPSAMTIGSINAILQVRRQFEVTSRTSKLSSHAFRYLSRRCILTKT